MNGKGEKFHNMSEKEFQVLDELYFLISFDELRSNLKMETGVVVGVLKKLLHKKWVRCYNHLGEQIEDESINLNLSYANYRYLATKAGLKAHNQS